MSIAPAQYPVLYAGDGKPIRVTLTDRSTGQPWDLTGCILEWRLAAKEGGKLLVSKSSPAGIEVEDAEGGVFLVKLDPADTAERFGPHWHQIVVTASGQPMTVLSAPLVIAPTIS